MIQALLLDFDGVVANTMPYHIAAWREVFSPLGIQLDPMDVYLREGSSANNIGRSILQKNNIQLPEKKIQELIDKKRQLYRQRTKAKLQEGIEELVAMAKSKKLKVALVTGSTWNTICTVLKDPFRSEFNLVITADDVSRNKPDPEPYLKAAEKIGVAPQQCLVVENAPYGIQAAKAAGMRCVAIQSTLPKEHLQGADWIFTDLHEMMSQFDLILNHRDQVETLT
ncbi:hypothetical protein DRQ15_02110 [candidate division KSB1 bacterium]|nr:MAG: hypothetical protein DRQ12_00255 [candidate division KSB1 bacterium]RKY92519.1 MAG: hypothetical protein DRQ15_02110 [candidate division KSB1 bacterium]